MDKSRSAQTTIVRSLTRLAATAFACTALFGTAHAEPPPRIEDNSFLIEEAYNQEANVVQHINLFIWDPKAESWEYTLTQEWPIPDETHQLSYTIPVQRLDEETGFGDLFLNYRWQALRDDTILFAPRASLLLPTGDGERGLGNDAVGYQFNLPLTWIMNDSWVSHYNLGTTIVPSSRGADSGRADTVGYNYGASLIYLAKPTFNLMLELVGTSDEFAIAPGDTDREETFFISPGVRGAINFESGLQIVPGVGVPIGVGPSSGELMAIGYLSIEHGF